MTRQQSVIPTPTAERIAALPTIEIPGPLYRICDKKYDSPWFFAPNADKPEGGRFDLTSPYGTCYWADDPLGAFFERLVDPEAPDIVQPESLLDDLTLWEFTPPAPLTVADSTAVKGGLPKELGAGVDYTPSWAWAAALHADGRSGILAWSRVAPHATRSIAIFGTEGAQPLIGGERKLDVDGWRDELHDLGLIEVDPTPAMFATPFGVARRMLRNAHRR